MNILFRNFLKKYWQEGRSSPRWTLASNLVKQ
jgi:hypothetical protein